MTKMNTPELTVYFDGACALCRGEVALLMQRNDAGRLAFVDIADPGFDPKPLGVSLDAMLSLMHARRSDGRWLIGVPAFQAIYAATGFHRLARGLRRPWVARLAARAYPWIVRHRHHLPRPLIERFFLMQLRSCRADGTCTLR